MSDRTDHDARHDLSAELWTVAELLDDDGKPHNAEACRDLAKRVRFEGENVLLATGLLGHYENLIGA
ncbi:hypothetical protein PBI_IRONMAN_90 [Mycobacterium phage IronMan]|uniref:DUF7273 domain-containing protein n=1 Tax=Mycobacterium phage IronMan TaxID=2499042 RepID=A0A3S9UDA0_9CAUD|nr:hypothetical protein KI247_gp11 [Mycobacterium phage IronMan]AZS08290.1 hypothetical protein PBI_IRONMAN_90 [Mycobacterium phage IronMan]